VSGENESKVAMLRLFTAAFIAAFFMPIFLLASNPQTAVKCGPYASRYVAGIHAMVMASHPNASSHDLEGEEKTSFIEGFNATPPVSYIPFDLVRIYTRPGSSNPLVLLGSKGCVLKATEVPTRVIRMWLKGSPVLKSFQI